MVPALRSGGDETRAAARAIAGQRARTAACLATSVSVARAPRSSVPLASMPYASVRPRSATSTRGVNWRRFMFG